VAIAPPRYLRFWQGYGLCPEENQLRETTVLLEEGIQGKKDKRGGVTLSAQGDNKVSSRRKMIVVKSGSVQLIGRIWGKQKGGGLLQLLEEEFPNQEW